MDYYERIDDGGKGRTGLKGTVVSISGVECIAETPEALAAAASQSVEVYSLARMIQSEDGSKPAPILLGLAECARNYAKRSGKSITKMLTASNVSGAAGKYGEQVGRWASTRADPSGRCIVAAQIAILENSDEFGGAMDFFDPFSMDQGTQNGRELKLTSEKYIADNADNGLEWVGDVDGVDPYHFMAFVPGAKPIDTSDSLEVLKNGRTKRLLFVGGGSLAALIVAIAGILAVARGVI